MHFPTEVLKGLGVFHPSGLNDQLRADETHTPFWAIDGDRPEELDDAVRVRRGRQGGFIVEVAMADGSQLSDSPETVQEAVAIGPSRYAPHTPRMLPREVVGQLELAHSKARRALVMRQAYDSDLQPVADVDFKPAIVIAKRIHFATLARKFAADSEHFAPLETVARENGVYTRTKEGMELNAYRATRIGSKTVEFYMQLVNRSFPVWAFERGIPFLSRSFQQEDSNLAHFTSSTEGHDGIVPGRRIPYTQVTSQLRRPGDLINGLNTGTFFAGHDYEYGQTQLDTIAKVLNSNSAQAAVSEIA